MTEENLNVENVEEVEQVDTQTETPQEEMYTKAQLEDIIAKRVQREKKATEKAVQEAEKLAKMNADEKEKYEREQLEERLAEYEKKDRFYSLSKEATNMLRDKDIPIDDEVLEVVVRDDAEGTKQRVEWFSSLLNGLVEQGVKKALSGNAPRVNVSTNGTGISKEKFQAMSYKERTDLRNKQPEVYELLTKGD